MAILSKAYKPDNFELRNALKLSLTNFWGLRLNIVDCESFLESTSPDILALCKTNLDDSVDSGNFSVRGYLPLISKDSSIHMHSLRVYVNVGPPFAWDLSLENSADSLSVLLLFLLSITFFVFVHGFYYIWSNIDEILLINPSANMFVFGDFNVHHKDWLTDYGGTDWPGELSVMIFLSQMTLLRWLTFLLGC